MGARVEVLDHGYVELVDCWGSDEAIIEAARMSTQKGFEGWGPRCAKCGHTFDSKIGACGTHDCDGREQKPGDEKLLTYLWKNKHYTPFEMAGATFEVQAPIFVFREWHRHRTQSYNEMSARYAPLPDLNYVPTVERLMQTSKANHQAGAAKGAKELTEVDAAQWLERLAETYELAQTVYEEGLVLGVPKELARLVLPVGRYSRMRASANLRNWLAFLTLRLDEHAQYEIRVYAEAVGGMLNSCFPRTYALFEEGMRE
jgi:thymidylate synthase (FAD)